MRRFPVAALAAALALPACDTLRPTDPVPAPDAAALEHRGRHEVRTPGTISLEKIGEFRGGGEAAAEITAYDALSRRLFVVNGALGTVDVLDLSDPAAPTRVATLSVGESGAAANSVATHRGLVAVAVEAHVKTAPGTVALYRAATLERVASVRVGALPDMVTFTPDGRHLLVANEGEPSDDYSVDPEGSVSVIDVSNPSRPVARTADFRAFDRRRASLLARGVRIYGPGASVSQDLEPEYIAVSPDGRTAYVTLQENNALALVDVRSARVTDVVPLGYKVHALPGNGFDASDRDGAVNIRPWPVLGMYQPDAIAAYEADGRTYLVTANEGDAREWGDFSEEVRVKDLELNPWIFRDALCGGPCRADERLGRLTVTDRLGRNPVTGKHDLLFAMGGRSFSIRDARGRLVWDSGDDLERRTADLPMAAFNAGNDGNDFDDRSDNKGPEPEGVVLGRLGRKTFAFVGLERVGGVMVYDVSRPRAPRFVTYANTRAGGAGDLGPEGLAFVGPEESPTGEPLLVVGNEVSGTTAVFRIDLR